MNKVTSTVTLTANEETGTDFVVTLTVPVKVIFEDEVGYRLYIAGLPVGTHDALGKRYFNSLAEALEHAQYDLESVCAG